MRNAATVLYDFVGEGEEELSVRIGDVVDIEEKEPTGWWLAKNAAGKLGWLPATYVREQVSSAAQTPSPAPEEAEPLIPRLEVERPAAPSPSQCPEKQLYYPNEEISTGPIGHIRQRPSIKRGITALLLSWLLITLMFSPVKRCYHQLKESCRKPATIEERVHSILSKTPLIDGHNDLPILIRFLYDNHIYSENFTEPFENGGMMGHVDLPRLREGLNGGAFWSVFAPCPPNGSDFSDENYASSVQMTLQQIDLVTRLKAVYSKDFSPMVNSSTALAAFKEGQLISPLGIEGLHQIGNSAANLRRFYALGVRYATLTHNCHNKFADAALLENPMRKSEPYWGGLSPLGRRLINEMNRIGMIVDLSHTSLDTMEDVLGGRDWHGSKAPVIYSHSSAFSVCPHPRNVPDHVLQLVKERNSLVMVNFAPEFISCVDSDNEDGIPDYVPANGTLEQVVKHILHIGNLIGFEHVGFGSDFDGIENVPAGLEDVSKFPALVGALLKHGVSDADVAKVVGGNLLRVWKDVDAVALKLQADGEPVLEDDLPSFRGPG